MIPAGLTFLAAGLLFAGMTLGLAWPLVARARLDPAEKLVAAAALSLLGIFLVGWLGFVAKLPVGLHWILPALALAGLLIRRAELRATWRDPVARELAVGQILVTAWCLGWLALVATYSGGGWAADWYEHWERTRFFLDRGAADAVFIEHASVTARPPLANVVIAALLSLTRANFAHYQLFSTLLASLAFAPAAMLARRAGSPAAIPVTAGLFMLNPMFVQNATFAWTKLPSAFFVLAALGFFLRAATAKQPQKPALLFSACLAAALLTHYSAGPFAVVLAVAWMVRTGTRRADANWWLATGAAVGIGAIVLTLWFGWAFSMYGASGTLLANTSVQAADATVGGQVTRMGLNLRDTLVPHFLRTLDPALITQSSPWGYWRDWFFQCYQVNLILAFGSVAWLVLAVALRRTWVGATPAARWCWAAAVGATIVLGVGVHGARDTWGLAHICLQPVVLAGLVLLAACAPALPRAWLLLLGAGAAIDCTFGLALHFGVQHLAFDRWLGPGRDFDAIFATYNQVAYMNVAAKVQHQLEFFSDALDLPLPLIALGLGAALATAAWRIHRCHTQAFPPRP